MRGLLASPSKCCNKLLIEKARARIKGETLFATIAVEGLLLAKVEISLNAKNRTEATGELGKFSESILFDFFFFFYTDTMRMEERDKMPPTNCPMKQRNKYGSGTFP